MWTLFNFKKFYKAIQCQDRIVSVKKINSKINETEEIL